MQFFLTLVELNFGVPVMLKPVYLLSLSLLAATVIQAAETTTFNVKLVITESCDITAAAATDVDFGTEVRSSLSDVTTGTLTVNCSAGTPYQIGLDDGNNFSSGQRRMGGSPGYVPYELYREAGLSSRWGNTGVSDRVAATGTAANQVVNIYGRVPSLNYAAGSYSDVITATITY
jgi:spore coat protein U-like protein